MFFLYLVYLWGSFYHIDHHCMCTFHIDLFELTFGHAYLSEWVIIDDLGMITIHTSAQDIARSYPKMYDIVHCKALLKYKTSGQTMTA
jgi:hypothetical protein